MKILLSVLFLLSVGCQQATKPVDPNPEAPAPVVVDKRPPVFIDAEGKKHGKCLLEGQRSQWEKDNWHGDRPACPANVKEFDSCDPQAAQGCKLPSGQKLQCVTDRSFVCYGWVYEKHGLQVKPLEGAKAYKTWFAGMMVGFHGPQSEVVLTDKNGYFEFRTKNLLDTVTVENKEGYFSLCQNEKPSKLHSGKVINTGEVEPKTAAFVQYKILPTSCTNNSPQ